MYKGVVKEGGEFRSLQFQVTDIFILKNSATPTRRRRASVFEMLHVFAFQPLCLAKTLGSIGLRISHAPIPIGAPLRSTKNGTQSARFCKSGEGEIRTPGAV